MDTSSNLAGHMLTVNFSFKFTKIGLAFHRMEVVGVETVLIYADES